MGSGPGSGHTHDGPYAKHESKVQGGDLRLRLGSRALTRVVAWCWGLARPAPRGALRPTAHRCADQRGWGVAVGTDGQRQVSKRAAVAVGGHSRDGGNTCVA